MLIGFPNTAGYREDHVVHCLAGTEDDPVFVPFGEVDGRITARTEQVARILESAPGFGAEIRSDMDTWLKYHVALLMPSLAPALYAAGTDNYRLARTRDLVVLTVRAIREGFQVLQARGLPITPSKYKIFAWLPEPILVLALQRLLTHELMQVAMVKHANAARDEARGTWRTNSSRWPGPHPSPRPPSTACTRICTRIHRRCRRGAPRYRYAVLRLAQDLGDACWPDSAH